MGELDAELVDVQVDASGGRGVDVRALVSEDARDEAIRWRRVWPREAATSGFGRFANIDRNPRIIPATAYRLFTPIVLPNSVRSHVLLFRIILFYIISFDIN